MNHHLESNRAKPPVSTSAPAVALMYEDVKDRDWLNPIAMSTLQKAVKRKDKRVILNGVEFAITYGIKTTFKASGEIRESVKLKRTDGEFAPFGYVPIKTIKEFVFEEKK